MVIEKNPFNSISNLQFKSFRESGTLILCQTVVTRDADWADQNRGFSRPNVLPRPVFIESSPPNQNWACMILFHTYQLINNIWTRTRALVTADIDTDKT